MGEAGRITPEGDARALRDALAELAGQPALRARLGAAGRARVLRHFTWERAAAQYKDIYDGLMSGSLASEESPGWAAPGDTDNDGPLARGDAPAARAPGGDG